MRRQAGFSLIELLIVVAIILIIAAIAIPNLLRARMAANESSAAASMRTLSTAEVSYKLSFPQIGYAALANLGGPASCTFSSTSACLIDSALTSGNKSGYTFAATPSLPLDGAMTQYVITAIPSVQGITGVKGFCVIEDHMIMYITPAAGPAGHDVCDGGTYKSVQ